MLASFVSGNYFCDLVFFKKKIYCGMTIAGFNSKNTNLQLRSSSSGLKSTQTQTRHWGGDFSTSKHNSSL